MKKYLFFFLAFALGIAAHGQTLTATPASFAFDLAMACNPATSCPFGASMTSIDAGRGVYGYQPGVVSLKNTGGASITVTSITASAGFGADQTKCITTIASGATCKLNIVFAPSDVGVLNGSVTVNFTGGPLTISVSGTGTLTITNATIPTAIPSFYQPTNGLFWAFPVVLPLSTQSTVETFTNRGSATTVTGLSVALNEGNSADVLGLTNFSLSTTCGASLAPNASCTATVTYAPLASGAHEAFLTLATSNAGTWYPEFLGQAVSSLLARTEANDDPYVPTVTGGFPTVQTPSYPGGVTTDGPAILPRVAINKTDAHINYANNTISGVAVYEVCPPGQNTGGTNCAYSTITLARQALQAAPVCGYWIKIHAQNLNGTQAIYNESLKDTDWPTAYNSIANPGSFVTCSKWNYETTDHLSSITPGNRVTPAWEGYTMLPGYPPFAQPVGGPGNYVPLIVGSTTNLETLRIPQAVGLKVRYVGLHFSSDPAADEGNTALITASYFNSSSYDFPDCVASPPATNICTPTNSIILEDVIVSGTPNYISICQLCVHGTGISMGGTSNSVIKDSYIIDIHANLGSHASTDAKAIAPGGSGFVPTVGLTVINSFLSAGSVIMEGGGSMTNITPTDFTFIGNFLWKPPFYIRANTSGQYGMPPAIFATPSSPEQVNIKGGIEFKNYNRVLAENNVIGHCTYTGQADQFAECWHLNNINNPNDGLLCGGPTPCNGFAPCTTGSPCSYAMPPTSPASSFSGVTVANVTIRNAVMVSMNKGFLIGNEYNQLKTAQLTPPIGSLGPFSVHDVLLDDMDGVKYGPKGGGGFNRIIAFTVSPPLVPAAQLTNPYTWSSWPGYIANGFNDKGRAAATNPFTQTWQRITAVSHTMNTARPPAAQTSIALAGIGVSDRSDAALILDASTNYTGGNCVVTVHYLSSQLHNIAAPPGGTKNLAFFDTPDIALVPGASGNSWVNLPNITVDSLIVGPPAGFVGHPSPAVAACPYVTSFSQSGLVYPGSLANTLPATPFLGFVDADNGPVVPYTGIQILDSIFVGDFQGAAAGAPSYDFNLDTSATANGYCWSGNMLVPTTGPNTLSLQNPTSYPGCASDGVGVQQNCIVGLATPLGCGVGSTGTFGDTVALNYAHFANGSWWKWWFGGTNDYTVGGIAATYSTTGGPIGPLSSLATNLAGVLDGVSGQVIPPPPPPVSPGWIILSNNTSSHKSSHTRSGTQ